jgi:tartrate dehydratase beta subunit/fumarate hydratase class I family protein
MGRAVARLDDVAMDEVHLTTPVSDEAIRSLKLGDVVYLSGALYTARECTARWWTRGSRSRRRCAR